MRRSRTLAPLVEFLSTEAASGVVLLAAVVVALVWANSPWSASYEHLWQRLLTIGAGRRSISLDLRHWVNDGLMALFFFVVGLEVKRELVRGELHDPRTAAVPAIAALGGMVVPAVLFLAWNAGGRFMNGWGIPMATDIALAVGVLALLGRHAPPRLRLFLLTLAIVDDIGAIVVIALFYSGDIRLPWVLAAVAGFPVLVVLRRRVTSPLVYVPIAVAIWVATFESGLHATIAGVTLGLLTPADAVHGRGIIERLEHLLHPWTSFVIVPLFALANAGVALGGHAIARSLRGSVGLGVIAGLAIGKPVGVVGAALLATACGLRLPTGIRRAHLVAGGVLAGIGFTVSLFIAELAFPSGAALADAKIAVLVASVVSGALGITLLRRLRSPAVTTVALVDDLMDRSRLQQALPALRFVRAATDCEGADVVVVDLARHVGAIAAIRAAAPEARIVGFGPHVDGESLSAAIDAGADEVLARSRFFRDPRAAVGE